MKVIVMKPFIDKEGVTRNPGDILTMSKERYEKINSTKHGIMVMAVAEETAKPTKTPKRKGGSKK